MRMGEMLAEGGFSMVYMARDEGNDSKYAVKKMICQTKEGLKDAQTEVKLLRAMDHPNIIPLMGHKVVDADRAKHYFLLFEYVRISNVETRERSEHISLKSSTCTHSALTLALFLSHQLSLAAHYSPSSE